MIFGIHNPIKEVSIYYNLGVAFIPYYPGANYNIGDNVMYLDIKDYDDVQIQYVWIMSSKKIYSKMIEDYITILKEELNAK